MPIMMGMTAAASSTVHPKQNGSADQSYPGTAFPEENNKISVPPQPISPSEDSSGIMGQMSKLGLNRVLDWDGDGKVDMGLNRVLD